MAKTASAGPGRVGGDDRPTGGPEREANRCMTNVAPVGGQTQRAAGPNEPLKTPIVRDDPGSAATEFPQAVRPANFGEKTSGGWVSPPNPLENGSGGRTRTCDPAVNSRLLYQLSYAG